MESSPCINLKVKPYLASFITNLYGDPVNLDKDSPESRILRKFIRKSPEGETPEPEESANLTVLLPYFKEADPRVYNHLPTSGKKLLEESFHQILVRNMLDEIGNLDTYFSGKISSLVEAWMEKHGIEYSETNWNTISQKYYRLRKKYVKHN
ncbi:MAG: hypothetical protein LBV74_01025 [Tannerella sp.]|jgi:hypothetical protein|nr:hypothetical protein [Tannerella sp.]